MNRMLSTSRRFAKTISTLVVAMFLCIQFASASHIHGHADEGPEPRLCVVCLAATHDDMGDLDIPSPPQNPILVPLEINLAAVLSPQISFSLRRVVGNIPEPPLLRLSAPRAPSV